MVGKLIIYAHVYVALIQPYFHASAILNDIFKNKTQTFAITLKLYAKYVPMDIVGGVNEMMGLGCPCYPSNSVFLTFSTLHSKIAGNVGGGPRILEIR